MTKTEFQTACKLLNGFEIEEEDYYKLNNGEVILIKKLLKNTLQYKGWMRDDLMVVYYDEFIGNIEKSTVSDFTFVAYPFLDQITKRYQHENYTWLLEAIDLKNNYNE